MPRHLAFPNLRRLFCAAAAGAALLAPAASARADLFEAAARALATQLPRQFSGTAPAPVSLPPGRSFANCANLFPGGQVFSASQVDAQWKPTELCFKSFAVLHSGLSKTPLVVVERLDRQQLADALDSQRTNEFYADPRLKAGSRAELDDFSGSGLDRGHMAPAGNQPDQEAMAQSFALSNIVPQDPFNNRKVWSKVESDTRHYARRAAGAVYVFSGPIFRGQPATIGPNRVWVPTHLYKLVFDEASGRSWAHILPNTAEARVGKPVGYAEFVQQTGLNLLPALN